MADKNVLEMMLSRYETRSGLDRENAIKEVLQRIWISLLLSLLLISAWKSIFRRSRMRPLPMGCM